NDEAWFGHAAAQLLGKEMSNGLQRLAQPHIISEHPTDAILAKVLQEAKPLALIGTQGCLQALRRRHELALMASGEGNATIAKAGLAAPGEIPWLVILKCQAKLPQGGRVHFSEAQL